MLIFLSKLSGVYQLKHDVLYEQRKTYLQHLIHNCSDIGIQTERYTDHDIIVSLTTYGKRIYDVPLTIESIMQQTMKANRIILWLDYSFEGQQLPKQLQKQQKRGLEVAFCKDTGPYKKLYPALCRFPNDAIITVDDDALYDFDLIERLIVPYLQDPHYIYCHRYHRMLFDSKRQLKPYNDWEWWCRKMEASHLNFATGVGGILYPPHALHEEALNEDVFMNICRTADDVWWKAMALMKGTRVKKVFSRNVRSEEFLSNENVQDIGLFHVNTKGQNMNDKQIKAVFGRYGLYETLSSELDKPTSSGGGKILVIIVTYNAMKWANQCLGSCRSSSIPLDIFVVDNGSTDGTQPFVKQNYPEAIFLQSNANLGFGKANNIGLQYALDNNYDYVYLLNQDAWIFPETIEKLIKVSKSYPQYGILSPFQMNADLRHIDHNFLSVVCSYKWNQDLFNDIYENDAKEVYQVKGVMAAHWLLTRKCIEKVGGFSPSFPHYSEDDNYLDRVKYWGFEIGIVPSLKVVHDRGCRIDDVLKKSYMAYTNSIRVLSSPLSGIESTFLYMIVQNVICCVKCRSLRPMSNIAKILLHSLSIKKNRRVSMITECAFLK